MRLATEWRGQTQSVLLLAKSEHVKPGPKENVRKVLSKDRRHPIAAAAPTFSGVPKNNVSQEIMDWWVRMMVDRCSLKVMLSKGKFCALPER